MNAPMAPVRSRSWLNRYWPIIVIGLLAVGFYGAVVHFAINVPIVDDLLYVFTLTRLLDPATDVTHKLLLLIEQHNDHRILLSRLAFLADYGIEGHLNFKTLIVVGSLSVAGSVWVFGRWLRWAMLPLAALLPVAFWLFQPSFHANLWWSLSVWQHTVTLFLNVLLLGFVLRPAKGPMAVALLVAALLFLSNSNGILTWLTITALLALNRRWQHVGVWAGMGLVLGFLYYGVAYDFRSQGSFNSIIGHPAWLLKSMLGFLGGSVYMDGWPWLGIPSRWLVLGLGIIILLVFIVAWLQLLLRPIRHLGVPFQLFSAMALILTGTGAAAALTRSNGQVQVIDRYQIYSLFCLICAYGLLLMWASPRWQRRVIVASSLIAGWFWVCAWQWYWPVLSEKKQALIAESFSLQHYNRSVSSDLFLLDPYWQGLWQQALRRGEYRHPATVVSTLNPNLNSIPAHTASGRVQQRRAVHTDISVGHPTIELQADTLPTPDFFAIQSEKETHLLAAIPQNRQKPFEWTTYRPVGANAFFYPEALPSGRYRIGWLQHVNTSPEIWWTDQFYEKP